MRFPKLDILNNKHLMALIGNITIAVFNVITMSLLLRTMTKVDVGVWFFFLSIYGLSDALRNGFLSTGTVKFYSGATKERGDAVLGSVWFLAIAASLALMVLDAFAMPFIPWIKSQEVILVIKWFGVTVLSSVAFNVTFWKLLADENYLRILALRFVNSGSMVLCLVVMMLMKKGNLENLLIINFLTNCLTSLVCIVLGYSKIETIVKRTRDCMKELVNFGKFSLATNLSSNLLGSADSFIITIMLGPTALAIYNVPVKLLEIVEILLRTFIGTGMSGMAIAYNNKNIPGVAFITRKYAGMLTFLFIPLAIGCFFFADFAIYILAGNKYEGTEAANIFRIFMFIAILAPIDRFNGVTLDIMHLPHINFYKVIIMIVVNVSTTVGGILLLNNIYGAAYTSPFSMLAGLGFGYYHLRKHLPGYTFKGIITTGWTEALALSKDLLQKYGLVKA